MRLLEEVRADFGEGICAAIATTGTRRALAIEQAVDEMQIAGAAAAGADGEVAGEMRVGAGGEGGDLFVAHVQPLMPPCRRMASVKPFRLSPTTP